MAASVCGCERASVCVDKDEMNSLRCTELPFIKEGNRGRIDSLKSAYIYFSCTSCLHTSYFLFCHHYNDERRAYSDTSCEGGKKVMDPVCTPSLCARAH